MANLLLIRRELQWEARGAWQLVVDSGRFAQHNPAPAIAGAGSAGETGQICKMRSTWDSLRTFFEANPGWE